MSYIALYRNYRPSAFKEVAGQEFIIKTLKNSIINNKTSHAYIFSGKRGVGKTTIARILAKAVNCLNPNEGEPCCECENCKAIESGACSDIIELDAASNNGVDEIRSLLEKVIFLPSVLTKKVYIIDEVHMLSNSAFNALLKTLEEPPMHVMFILATTEPYKVPETILSRCQRFDFQQLSIDEISFNLKYIVEKENISIQEEAIYEIAEAAEGGMRDAVNILDQVSANVEGEISVSDVDSLTGKVSDEYLISLVNSFREKDSNLSLQIVNELLNTGKDVSRILSNLVNLLKDTLLYKCASDLNEQKNIYNKEIFKELASKLTNQDIFFYIDVLMDTYNKSKFSNSSRLYLEIAVLKIINGFNNVDELSTKVNELENLILNGEIGSNGSINSDAEMKISELNLQVKKIISELEKMDLRTFKEDVISKMKYIENIQIEPTSDPYDDSKILNIIENLKNEVENIKNRPQNTVVDFDPKPIENEISLLKDEIKEIKSLNTKKEELPEIQKRSNPFRENEVNEELTQNDVIEESKTQIKEIEKKIELNNNFEEDEKSVTESENIDQVEIEDKSVESLQDFKAPESPSNEESELSIQTTSEDDEKLDSNANLEEEPKAEEFVETQVEAPVLEEATEEGNISEIEKIQNPSVSVRDEKMGNYSISQDGQKMAQNEEIFEKQQPIFEQDKTIQKNEPEIVKNPYDVSVLERILHESRDPSRKSEMILLKEKWNNLSEIIGIETSTVKILKDGVLTANGNGMILLVYPTAQYCNRLMSVSIHKEACKILSDAFSMNIDFLALPENTWQQKRNEYHDQYRIGIKYPKLTPIENPDLKIVDIKEMKSSTDQLYDLAISIFGEDVVKKDF